MREHWESDVLRREAIDRRQEADSCAQWSEESEQRRRMIETTTSRSDETIVTTVREYDTDKPVDTTTGRPPIKREITRSSIRTDSGLQQQRSEAVKKDQRDNDVRLMRREDEVAARQEDTKEHIDVQGESREKRGMNAMQRGLCFAGLLAIAIGICYLAVRILKKRLKPF